MTDRLAAEEPTQVSVSAGDLSEFVRLSISRFGNRPASREDKQWSLLKHRFQRVLSESRWDELDQVGRG